MQAPARACQQENAKTAAARQPYAATCLHVRKRSGHPLGGSERTIVGRVTFGAGEFVAEWADLLIVEFEAGGSDARAGGCSSQSDHRVSYTQVDLALQVVHGDAQPTILVHHVGHAQSRRGAATRWVQRQGRVRLVQAQAKRTFPAGGRDEIAGPVGSLAPLHRPARRPTSQTKRLMCC